MDKHVLYMIAYALVVMLSLHTLYTQTPRAWRTSPASLGPTSALLVRVVLAAWVVFSSGVVLVVFTRWIA